MDPANVDAHVTALLSGQDDAVLTRALARAEAAGLPQIAVSPLQGKHLHLLARAIGARRILELGTLGGYSAVWLARALPTDGRLVTVELDPGYAAVASETLRDAGIDAVTDLRIGPALDVLDAVDGPFDLAFLDADKATMDQQLEKVIPRVRSGGVIVCDNVIRAGAVVDGDDASARGARRTLERLGSDPRVDATVLQTVGLKGHDGFAIAVVS